MTAARPIYFNGKFYSRELNGVHRVADRLIRECDARLSERPPYQRPQAVLFAPADSAWLPELRTIRIERVGRGGQLWEQVMLARRASDGILVNLANLAPIVHRRKLTMVHDVQFLFDDSGFSLAQRLGYKLLVPRIARSSQYVCTVSDFSKRMLQVFGVSDADRIVVVPNGADHILEASPDAALRMRLGLRKSGYVVMFGSPKPYKNNAVVLDAFANGAMGETRLVIVGPRREVLEQAGLTPPSDALFAGRVDDGALRALLSDALAIAFPSRTEGFGLPPLEAMLCDCPVVASPAGAIPEVCVDAVSYAGVDDPIAWRDAFIALREDEGLREAKIAAGRRRARQFTWAASGSMLLDLVDRMAEA